MNNNRSYLPDAIRQFEATKSLTDRAIAQVSDDDFIRTLSDDDNSIAVIVKHLAGNMHSRWRDFLTTDGEKVDRNRDTEFELCDNDTRESLFAYLESGWTILFDTLKSLSDKDTTKTIYIRSEPYSVVAAINRQLTHYSYHVGQIVLLAKSFSGDKWKSLSIPKGKSKIFNNKMQNRFKDQS